jgi:hypothetical protein
MDCVGDPFAEHIRFPLIKTVMETIKMTPAPAAPAAMPPFTPTERPLLAASAEAVGKDVGPVELVVTAEEAPPQKNVPSTLELLESC